MRVRIEVLAANVANLTLEIRGWRAAQARRGATTEQDGFDALVGVLIASIERDAVFSAADVVAHALIHLELRQALAFASASNGRRVGNLLVRLEGRGTVDGLHFVRIGVDRNGVLW